MSALFLYCHRCRAVCAAGELELRSCLRFLSARKRPRVTSETAEIQFWIGHRGHCLEHLRPVHGSSLTVSSRNGSVRREYVEVTNNRRTIALSRRTDPGATSVRYSIVQGIPDSRARGAALPVPARHGFAPNRPRFPSLLPLP
ncbi:MAG: hypothetical protein ACRD1Z_18075 [Vicinamibacteria bacterium]